MTPEPPEGRKVENVYTFGGMGIITSYPGFTFFPATRALANGHTVADAYDSDHRWATFFIDPATGEILDGPFYTNYRIYDSGEAGRPWIYNMDGTPLSTRAPVSESIAAQINAQHLADHQLIVQQLFDSGYEVPVDDYVPPPADIRTVTPQLPDIIPVIDGDGDGTIPIVEQSDIPAAPPVIPGWMWLVGGLVLYKVLR